MGRRGRGRGGGREGEEGRGKRKEERGERGEEKRWEGAGSGGRAGSIERAIRAFFGEVGASTTGGTTLRLRPRVSFFLSTMAYGESFVEWSENGVFGADVFVVRMEKGDTKEGKSSGIDWRDDLVEYV